MRLKILGVILAIVLGSVATTFALFSDSATVNSEFASGTVKIYGYRVPDTLPGPMFYTTKTEGSTPKGLPGRRPTGLWTPGDTSLRMMFVENRGSLDVWLTGVSATMHTGTSRHLAEKLVVKVTTDLAGTDILAAGTMAAFIDAPQAFSHRLAVAAGSPFTPTALYFYVTLPLDADDTYQGGTLKVDFEVSAEQKQNNP